MNKKITQLLLVEDNQVDRWLTQTALEAYGYQGHLHVVDEGNEALNFLLKLGPHQEVPTPDIILLDLHMPIMNGIEFLTRLKGDTQFKTIPVVDHHVRTRKRPGNHLSLRDRSLSNQAVSW